MFPVYKTLDMLGILRADHEKLEHELALHEHGVYARLYCLCPSVLNAFMYVFMYGYCYSFLKACQGCFCWFFLALKNLNFSK